MHFFLCLILDLILIKNRHFYIPDKPISPQYAWSYILKPAGGTLPAKAGSDLVMWTCGNLLVSMQSAWLQDLLDIWINYSNAQFKSRNKGYNHVVVYSLALFLMKINQNTPHLSALNPLPQMCNDFSNFILQLLAGDNCNLFTIVFAYVEVTCQFAVMYSNNYYSIEAANVSNQI